MRRKYNPRQCVNGRVRIVRKSQQDRVLMREVLAMREYVQRKEVELNHQKDEINAAIQEVHKLNATVENRVEYFGRKKTAELSKIKDSAIKKLNQLISMCDLKVKDGVITQ